MADLNLTGVAAPWTCSFVPGASGRLTVDPVLHGEIHVWIPSGIAMEYGVAASDPGAAGLPLPTEQYVRVWEAPSGVSAPLSRCELTFEESGGTSGVVYVRVVAR